MTRNSQIACWWICMFKGRWPCFHLDLLVWRRCCQLHLTEVWISKWQCMTHPLSKWRHLRKCRMTVNHAVNSLAGQSVSCGLQKLRVDYLFRLHFGRMLCHLLVKDGEPSERPSQLVRRQKTTRSVLPGEGVLRERLQGLALWESNWKLSELKKESHDQLKMRSTSAHAHRTEELKIWGRQHGRLPWFVLKGFWQTHAWT